MTPAAPSVSANPRARRYWVVAVVLLLVALGCLALGLRGQQDGGNGTTGAPSGTLAPPVPRSVPVALRIPAIDVSVSVSALGLNPDQTVEVPTDFQEPGWYQLGTSPGELGSAVILGHVDSYRGPAVFYRLRSLRAGDTVEVDLTDGTVARFLVTAVETYPKEQFPAEQVYGSPGHSALQLVTCGGEFDTHTRSYRSNVVAYTSLVATTPAAAATAAPRHN